MLVFVPNVAYRLVLSKLVYYLQSLICNACTVLTDDIFLALVLLLQYSTRQFSVNK